MPIDGTCAIGRSPFNQLVLDDERVSRHHAVVRMTDTDGCWIIDLGSSNGTSVNARRVNRQRLRDGDTITIGTSVLVFRWSAATEDGASAALLNTVHDIRSLRAWLLLVDIEGSTGISRRLGAVEMDMTYNQWMTRCQTILQETGGLFDKLLGDGFLAFWPTGERTAADVARALGEFHRFRSNTALPFRIALHLGTAFTGGEIASGTYRLFGADVTFTFRMEGLAKTLGTSCLLSLPAHEELQGHVKAEPTAPHTLPGLEGTHLFFRL